ncbi:MAG: GMC family oxidoreductase [Myxococcales bacterium]|nr:GMC family oxidoreductase [Myxococcales bacterium]MCB9642280.1 GMC family oxidoreductase [Myxococcales bacterium]
MILQGSKLQRDFTLKTDVLVIGSGSGGAVVAHELARAGREVVVVEEGRYIRPEVYGKWRPSQTLRRIGRAGGTTVALGVGDSPTINILAGSCVGGSSVMTGGVCFRIPEEVHDGWVRSLGTTSLSAESMVPFYEHIEQMSHVQPVPVEMRTRGTELFVKGAQRLGREIFPVSRNTKGCCGCSRCNFGCPHQAKLSVDLTFLPKAQAAGAQIFSDFRVERILVERGRAVGVEGVILREPDRQAAHRFTLRANTVVLAAGTLHSPLIMMRSRIGRRSGQVGRNITLHPAFRVGALFDDPIYNWRGALQGAYCTHPTDDRLIFIGASAPVNFLTATVPGLGPAWVQKVHSQMRHMATFGGMVHDQAGGRIWTRWGSEPIITYHLDPQDKVSMLEGIRFLAEVFFAAGARELLLPIIGLGPVRDMDHLRKVNLPGMPGSRVECLSFHPLGSCRMGADPQRAVVDVEGQSFDVRGLWVADGSIFPSSVGVNTQVPIMTMAARTAAAILEHGNV